MHVALLLFLQLHELVAMSAKNKEKCKTALPSSTRGIGHQMHVIV